MVRLKFKTLFVLDFVCWLRAYAKPAEMAHSGKVFQTVSGALANIGMHHNLGEIPAPVANDSSAKQRRLSPANTNDEIRRMKRDRRKRKRKEEKLLPKKEKRTNLVARVTKQVDRLRETEIRESSMRAEENRKKLFFSGESGKKKGGTKRVLLSK